MMLVFPSTTRLFEEKNCGIKKFDTVFQNIISTANDGYFTISEKEDEVYLFVVGGRPYSSGRIEKEGLSFLDIHEFFDTYSRIGTANLAFYKVEKKALLSLLVYFKKRPAQKFSADMVDMEKVLNDLAQKGTDSIVAAKCGDKIGFCICLKGKPSFNYLPDGAYANEQPKDGLLLYVFGQNECVPSIEIFDNIQMTPAPDIISSKDELPKSLAVHYIKKPPAQASISGAEVVLMLANTVINKYSITKAETTIGRSAGSDIAIENPGVSRHHAVIMEKNGKFMIEDKGSANGTFMNGEKITSKELKDSDKVQILNYVLTFKLPQVKIEEKTVYVDPSAVNQKKPGTAKLVIEGGKEFTLQSTVMTVGSGEDMGLRLEGRGIEDHQASILRGKGGEFTLMHKGGRTPTKVNGEKVQEHHLKNGDVIEMGQYKINYKVS
ncbi:MAG: FHA domain-containing protein [Deltaproteobacteria bacterium]|nr:FHA domain-containing protein [Deltaproteobacteria bacterium]